MICLADIAPAPLPAHRTLTSKTTFLNNYASITRLNGHSQSAIDMQRNQSSTWPARMTVSYFTMSSNSTSKISVEPGGIPGTFWLP